jgi:hypothetical protein
VGQRGHAGDRPEHEPEPEDGLHLLFLSDHSTGRIVPRCSIVARQQDTGTMTATRRPANTTKAPVGSTLCSAHASHPHMQISLQHATTKRHPSLRAQLTIDLSPCHNG